MIRQLSLPAALIRQIHLLKKSFAFLCTLSSKDLLVFIAGGAPDRGRIIGMPFDPAIGFSLVDSV